MAVVLLRGAVVGAGAEATFTEATWHLIAFSAVGVVVGTIAQSTVEEAVRRKLERQLEDAETD